MFWKLENSADDQICATKFLNFLQPDMICNELVTKIFNEKKKCAESRLEPEPFLASNPVSMQSGFAALTNWAITNPPPSTTIQNHKISTKIYFLTQNVFLHEQYCI